MIVMRMISECGDVKALGDRDFKISQYADDINLFLNSDKTL